MRLISKDRYYSTLLEVYEKNIEEQIERHQNEQNLSAGLLLDIYYAIEDYRKDGITKDDLVQILEEKLKRKAG